MNQYPIWKNIVKSGKNELKLKRVSGQEGLTLLDVAILYCRDADDSEIKELAALCFND